MNAIDTQGTQSLTENQLSKIIFDCALKVGRKFGLFINFSVTMIKNGLRGVVNKLVRFAFFAKVFAAFAVKRKFKMN